jgi:hypothetical protein
MDQIVEFLDNELSRYKKNHKPLGKQKRQDVERAISELLVDRQRRNQGLYFLKSFPAEISANAVSMALNQLNGQDFIDVHDLILQDESFQVHHGLKRYILILGAFMQKSPEYSLSMLIQLAQLVTNHGKKLPSVQICGWFYESLVKSRIVKNVIPYLNGLSKEEQFLVSLLLLVSSIAQGMHEFGLIEDFLIKEFQIPSLLGSGLPEKIRKELEEKTNGWLQEQKLKLKEFGLFKDFQPLNVIENESVNDQEDHKEWNYQKALSWLQEYMDRLHTENGELTRKYIELKRNLEHYLEKYRELENEIELKRREIREKENEMIVLLNELNETKQLLNKKEQELVNQQSQFKEEIERLIEMSERESKFSTNELKQRLSRKLRIEVEDFNEIKDDEMTVELGENLRFQMENIFNILRAEGILD